MNVTLFSYEIESVLEYNRSLFLRNLAYLSSQRIRSGLHSVNVRYINVNLRAEKVGKAQFTSQEKFCRCIRTTRPRGSMID